MNGPIKKILYLSPNGFLGGAERFVLDAAFGHIHLGKHKAIIFFLNQGEAYLEAQKKEIPCALLPFKMRLSRPISLIKTILYLRRFIINEQIDVINETMPYSHIIGFFATWGLRVKTVWYQHGPVGGFLDKIAVMLRADLILFNSKYLQECHKKTASLFHYPSPEKICHYGISISSITEAECLDLREKWQLTQKKVWIHAARICSWKGQHLLIQAFKLLKDQRPEKISNVVLLVLGKANNDEDKKYFKRLQDLVAQFQLENEIKFLGHQSNTQTFFKISELVFHSSTIPEPFGLSVAEAMGQNSLVIGSNQGGVCDILIEGVTGFTFNPQSENSAQVLFEKICDVLDRPQEQLERIRQSGQLKIKEEYSLKSMIQTLELCYQTE